MALTRPDDKAIADAIGELLTSRGRLDPADLERVRRLQQETREGIHLILTKLGLVPETEMAQVLGELLDVPLAERADFPDEPVLAESLGIGFLKEHRIVPLDDTGDGVVLAMADPLDGYAVDAVRLATRKPVVLRIGLPADIEAAHERLYQPADSAPEHGAEGGLGADDVGTEADIERLKDIASEAPVIRLVNRLISRAVEMRASDIHVEPFERTLKVRYRVDGALRDMEAPANALRAALTSRIKLLANLNIAETRLPQDGRMRQAVRGKEVDFRVSTVPTMHGESIVLRVLDRESVDLDFTVLGLSGDILDSYLRIIDEPNGVVLVTGPTGSGKTTTLYTSLIRLNTEDRKVLTVEDPVEYQLHGINQVQVKPRIGLSFANTLRSLLRHDPDVIMIGEIRDLETAEIAVQAALTGHKVLSTLHTNGAASSITRLLDMGVDDFLVTSTVNGVVAQRLIRTLCSHCRKPHKPPAELLKQWGLRPGAASGFHQAVGCDKCTGTGYLGRTSIMEILVMSDEIRRLVLKHAEAREIERAALDAGMRTMFRAGIDKAAAGETTAEEVMRVTRDA